MSPENSPGMADAAESGILAYSATMKPALFKTLAAGAKLVVEEASFTINESGLIFRAMDPSHVELIDIFIPLLAFERFDSPKGGRFTLRTEDMVKLASRLDNGDESVTLAEGDSDLVAVSYAGKLPRTFSLHTVDSPANDAPLPKLKLPATAKLTKGIMEKIMGDIGVVSDQVAMRSGQGKLAFSGRSDIGRAEIVLHKEDSDVLELGDAEAKATYSMDYLAGFLKQVGGASGADVVGIEFASQKPIVLTLTLGDQGGYAKMFLAPRVAQD